MQCCSKNFDNAFSIFKTLILWYLMVIMNFILKRGNKEFGFLSLEDFNALCLCLAMMTFPKGGVVFRLHPLYL